MLDRLRCRDEGCIENGLVLDFARDLIGFLNDAVDAGQPTPCAFSSASWDTCSSRFTWFSVSYRWV
jgi:hypothetical protein